MAQWNYKIYVGDIIDLEVPNDITWEDKRDQIVARIKGSLFFRKCERACEVCDETGDVEFYLMAEELCDLVMQLSETQSGEEWDDVMYDVYNIFDDERVWFDIFDKNPPVRAKLFLIPREA